MLGTFLPWVTAPIIGSIAGTAGDGWITFGIFAIALLVTLGSSGVLTTYLTMGLGIVNAYIAVNKIINVEHLLNQARGEAEGLGKLMAASVQIGIGLYLVAGCGVVLALLAFFQPRDQKEHVA